MARSLETRMMMRPMLVLCPGNCGTLVPCGSGYCWSCARFETELEERRHNALRVQHGARLLPEPGARVPRVNAGVAVMPEPVEAERNPRPDAPLGRLLQFFGYCCGAALVVVLATAVLL